VGPQTSFFQSNTALDRSYAWTCPFKTKSTPPSYSVRSKNHRWRSASLKCPRLLLYHGAWNITTTHGVFSRSTASRSPFSHAAMLRATAPSSPNASAARAARKPATARLSPAGA